MAVLADRPTGGTLHMALQPPAIQDTQTWYAIERGLHATGPGSLVGLLGRVKPHVCAAGKMLGQGHVIFFQVSNADVIFEGGSELKDAPDDGLAALVGRMGFAAV